MSVNHIIIDPVGTAFGDRKTGFTAILKHLLEHNNDREETCGAIDLVGQDYLGLGRLHHLTNLKVMMDEFGLEDQEITPHIIEETKHGRGMILNRKKIDRLCKHYGFSWRVDPETCNLIIFRSASLEKAP